MLPEPCGVCTLTSYQDIGIRHGLWLALTYTKSEIKKKLCKNSTARDIFLSLKHYKEKVFVSIALSLQNMFLFFSSWRFFIHDDHGTSYQILSGVFCTVVLLTGLFTILPFFCPAKHFKINFNDFRTPLLRKFFHVT